MARRRHQLSGQIPPVYVPAAPLAVVRQIALERARIYRLTAELAIIDIVMQRWAVSIGAGLPTETWDERQGFRPVPLDDLRAIAVDQLVLHSPYLVQSIIKPWYKTPTPVRAIGSALRIAPASVVIRWRGALKWMHPRLVAASVID